MHQTIKTSANQRGMTFWGTLVVLSALLLLGTVGMKTLPAYLEFNAVKTAIKKIGRDSGSGATKKDVVDAFNRQASIDNIDSIKGAELSYEGGVVSANYQVVVPLFGNISILLDFEATSAK
jgi:Domain of unknown function (DUF4845)